MEPPSAVDTARGEPRPPPCALSAPVLSHAAPSVPVPRHGGSRVCVRARGEAAQDSSLSTPGLTKEKLRNRFWSMLLMSRRSAEDSRGRSLRNSLSKLLQSLGDFWAGVGGGEEGRDSAAGPSPRRRSPRPGPGDPLNRALTEGRAGS